MEAFAEHEFLKCIDRIKIYLQKLVLKLHRCRFFFQHILYLNQFIIIFIFYIEDKPKNIIHPADCCRRRSDDTKPLIRFFCFVPKLRCPLRQPFCKCCASFFLS